MQRSFWSALQCVVTFKSHANTHTTESRAKQRKAELSWLAGDDELRLNCHGGLRYSQHLAGHSHHGYLRYVWGTAV